MSSTKKAKDAAPSALRWKEVAAALLAYKAWTFALVYASVHMLSGVFNATNYSGNFHWPEDAPITLWSVFKTWDAQHYLQLAQEGYRAGSASNQFYPLWPMAMRAGAFLLGGDYLFSGLILSNLFSWLGAVLFYVEAEKRYGEKTADAALLLLLAYPGALFLQFAFTESLFLLLAVLLLRFLREERPGATALAAFLLPLTRPQGILIAPAVWYGVWKAREGRGLRGSDFLAAAAPLAGFAAYLAFMRATTGDALAGFHAYAAMVVQPPTVGKLFDVAGFVREFVHVTAIHGYTGSLIDRVWFVVWAASLWPLWRRDKVLFAYAVPLGLVPAMSLGMVSYTRHFLLVLPVFFLGGIALAGEERKWVLRPLLAVLFSLQIAFLIQHVNDYWVG